MERENDVLGSGFDVDKLEAIIIDEAERRGDRLYRIILTPAESAFFPRERISIDVARMESSFNVVRVCPEPGELPRSAAPGDFPGRIAFFITTMLPFERAAALAASRLNGAVDIAEIPFSSWEDEKERWCAEAVAAPSGRKDAAKADMALLVLSYKILRYDMGRILEAVKPGAGAEARASMSRFESRLASSQAMRIPFLAYKLDGLLHLVPRFMVRGFYFTENGKRSSAILGEGEARAADDHETRTDGLKRFGILLEGEDGERFGSTGADRLVSYGELSLGEIEITGRASKGVFEVEARGERARLLLPETPV